MNTLIISTFSCTFEEFKNDVTTLFLEEMCKEFVTDYEFVKVNDHKSHLLMNCTDLEKLGAEMESPFAKEWDEKNQTYAERPKHDWASHGADAFRYLAWGFRGAKKKRSDFQEKALDDYNIFA